VISTVLQAVVVVALLMLIPGALLAWANQRWPRNASALIERIDQLLPQTQCAQCGYPGCRPYAQAIASGEAIDLCPPGGETTHRALSELLGQTGELLGQTATPLEAQPLLARIDEARCIGCALCLPACPVDAIVGAPRFMHTVVSQVCTGCELCVAPCPVDCIDLLTLEEQRNPWPVP
jgi:electron transport complex protein RnfB